MTRVRAIGWLSLASIMIHGGNHVRLGTAVDLLWACNVATGLLALGCLLENPRLAAIPVMWLCFGTPIWILDLATGGIFMATSVLTHIGALVIGLGAVRELGVPRYTWPIATLSLIAVMVVCRLFTPPALNINLAHAVWAGWENTFPRYDVYFAIVVAAFSATFFVVERALRRGADGQHNRRAP